MIPRSVLASVPSRATVLGWPVLACVALVVALATAASSSVAAQDGEEAVATLTERNDSGVSGTVELAARDDRTRVVVRAEGALGVHPTHIHRGNCGDLDPNPKYPLNNVELATTELTGLSETVIDVPLREFVDEEHLVLIHKTAVELGNYLACGDIEAGEATASGGDGAAGRGGPLGSMGSGSAAGREGPGGWPLALGALAAGLGLGGWALGRRRHA